MSVIVDADALLFTGENTAKFLCMMNENYTDGKGVYRE